MDESGPRLLTGDEVGLLLLDFACRDPTGSGGHPVAVTTVATTPLADAIAEANGVELRRTLTGFKYVGEQAGFLQAEGRGFLLGLEESDGYLRGSYVRDKDGINALVMACEIAAHYKARNMTLADALTELYRRYGFISGRQLVREFPSATSATAMARVMGNLRANAPTEIAGLSVEHAIDYLPGARMPVVGGVSNQLLPPSDVLEWRLAGGSRVLVRPSGTEPKLKAYIFARDESKNAANALLDALCEGVLGLIN
jgi:phosphoglucomutase